MLSRALSWKKSLGLPEATCLHPLPLEHTHTDTQFHANAHSVCRKPLEEEENEANIYRQLKLDLEKCALKAVYECMKLSVHPRFLSHKGHVAKICYSWISVVCILKRRLTYLLLAATGSSLDP